MDDQIQGQPLPESEVTTEAEPQQTAPQTEGTETQPEVETPVEKTFTQAELDEILAKKTAKLIRQRERERAQRELYEQQLTKVALPQTLTAGEPQLEQFADPREYAKAVVAFEKQQEQLRQQALEAQKKESSFQEKRDDFIDELKETPGFEMEKFNRLPISESMAEAILESDSGTKLVVHLTENPQEAQRIASLSPARQAAEIGKLEAKLATAAAPKSNAPKPLQPVKPAAPSGEPDPADTDRWIAWRRKQRNS
jgi:hypothetical protein